MEGATDVSADMPVTQETCCRVEDLHLSFVADKEVAKENAQWRDPEMKADWGATDASPLEWVDAAIAASTADQCSKALG